MPIVELAVWSALVLLPTVKAYARFSAVQKYGSVNLRSGEFELMVPRDRWLTISLAAICEQRFHLVAGLNLPGAVIGAPLTVPVVSFLRKHPSGLSAEIWNTISLPFFCLPAWWFVGRGLDALLAGRRLHWGMLSIGSILSCVCVALVIGILTSPPADRTDMVELLPGGIFWAIAFAALPANWLVSRRDVNHVST